MAKKTVGSAKRKKLDLSFNFGANAPAAKRRPARKPGKGNRFSAAGGS